MSRIYLIGTIAILALSGCKLGNSTGYVPTETQIQNIDAGIDNEASIEDRFGRPTVIGESGRIWYYISSRRQHPGSLPTREVNRRILVIGFDEGGRVVNHRQFGLESGRNIAISRFTTETGGRELTIWEQLLGSVGNLSPEQFLAGQ